MAQDRDAEYYNYFMQHLRKNSESLGLDSSQMGEMATTMVEFCHRNDEKTSLDMLCRKAYNALQAEEVTEEAGEEWDSDSLRLKSGYSRTPLSENANRAFSQEKVPSPPETVPSNIPELIQIRHTRSHSSVDLEQASSDGWGSSISHISMTIADSWSSETDVSRSAHEDVPQEKELLNVEESKSKLAK